MDRIIDTLPVSEAIDTLDKVIGFVNANKSYDLVMSETNLSVEDLLYLLTHLEKLEDVFHWYYQEKSSQTNKLFFEAIKSCNIIMPPRLQLKHGYLAPSNISDFILTLYLWSREEIAKYLTEVVKSEKSFGRNFFIYTIRKEGEDTVLREGLCMLLEPTDGYILTDKHVILPEEKMLCFNKYVLNDSDRPKALIGYENIEDDD